METTTGTNEVDEIVTRELAASVRPALDDPSRLGNGGFHPRYIAWLIRPGEQTNPWLHVTFPILVERLPHTDDGYLDRDAVRAALGPRWSDVIQGRHLAARTPTWERLAALADLPADEVMGHVDRARVARAEHERMIQSCRTMPYKLQTWSQMEARQPCPGCGHPWLEPDTPAAASEFAREHENCAAGGTAVGDGRRHCTRCCGYPDLSPDTRAAVNALFERARREQEAHERAAQNAAREESNRTKRIERRGAEIARLEAQLEKLRVQQSRDIKSAT